MLDIRNAVTEMNTVDSLLDQTQSRKESLSLRK